MPFAYKNMLPKRSSQTTVHQIFTLENVGKLKHAILVNNIYTEST